MSILQYPDAISAPNVQIYHNATFDNAEESAIAVSWTPLQPISINSCESIESDLSKENRSPIPTKCHPSDKRGKPLKLLFKQGLLSPPSISSPSIEPKKIDTEIEQIEKEIDRLSSRLETLRIEKAAIHDPKTVVDRRQSIGRIVRAKFMEPKQSSKIVGKKIQESSSILTGRRVSLGPSEIFSAVGFRKSGKAEIASTVKKIEESPATVRRRGVSLGPSEIASSVGLRQSHKLKVASTAKKIEESPATGRRKGSSLGPSEIVKFRQDGKPEIPSNRRKSSFFTLPEIAEVPSRKANRRSLSLSPKSRPSVITDPGKGISTVSWKKTMKKANATLVNPKKLFNGEDERTSASKKASKSYRDVPSRYAQTPENDKEEGKRMTRGILSSSGRYMARGSRAKRQWEIPGDVLEKSPPSIVKIAESLPKIRAVRCDSESPRDSGPAKRVADLVGRKSYFGSEDEEEESVCTVLGFEEE